MTCFSKAIDELKSLFGDQLSTSNAIREQHGKDESSHPAALPDAVLFARSTADVSEAVKICAAHKMPIIPFGAGTSLEGHVLAVNGGLSIDMTAMDKVIAVNEADLDVRIEAGITRKALNTYLRSYGLFFPVDPGADCTLGGMVATRASGTNAVRYGTMREQVLSLKVVTASGEVIETGTRARKSSTGYDLSHLFTGSEGTLGIITEMSIRVHGIPEKIGAGTCTFPTLKDAIDTVIATIQMGIPVSRIELLDEMAIEAVNAYSRLSLPVQPTLFMEFAGGPAAVDEQIDNFREIATGFGGSELQFATTQEDVSKLWRARHQLYYATKAWAPGKHVITTDVCVPISQLAECMEETREDIAASNIQATMLGHVGDGNFHSILLADPKSDAEMQEANALNQKMVRRAIEMGGSATGEHGIGLGKREFLEWEKGAAIPLMRQIKAALDPDGIMNPGKIF